MNQINYFREYVKVLVEIKQLFKSHITPIVTVVLIEREKNIMKRPMLRSLFLFAFILWVILMFWGRS